MSSCDEIFWDRILDMPYLEAIQECAARKSQLLTEIAELRSARSLEVRAGIVIREAQIHALNAHTKRLHTINDRVNWRKAVEALYGYEVVEQCIIWMEQQRVSRPN